MIRLVNVNKAILNHLEQVDLIRFSVELVNIEQFLVNAMNKEYNESPECEYIGKFLRLND